MRRTPAEYDWDKLQFDETILTKHFTEGDHRIIKFVAVHHMAMVGTGNGAALDAVYRTWQVRPASAHYGIDGIYVRQFVWDRDIAWAVGNWTNNVKSISIEHANSTGKPGWMVAWRTWRRGARLVAHLHKTYDLGRPERDVTVRRHRDCCSRCTECPGPYLGGVIWKWYCKRAGRVYDKIT